MKCLFVLLAVSMSAFGLTDVQSNNLVRAMQVDTYFVHCPPVFFGEPIPDLKPPEVPKARDLYAPEMTDAEFARFAGSVVLETFAKERPDYRMIPHLFILGSDAESIAKIEEYLKQPVFAKDRMSSRKKTCYGLFAPKYFLEKLKRLPLDEAIEASKQLVSRNDFPEYCYREMFEWAKPWYKEGGASDSETFKKVDNAVLWCLRNSQSEMIPHAVKTMWYLTKIYDREPSRRIPICEANVRLAKTPEERAEREARLETLKREVLESSGTTNQVESAAP